MLIIFLVPGFVWRTVEGQLVYLDKRLGWERFALGLLSRSTFTCLPLAPWLWQAYQAKLYEGAPLTAAGIALAVILILPALLGFLSGIARRCGLGRKLVGYLHFRAFEQHNIPSAWDHLFSGITPRWVIVTLKSGGRIHGFFGPDSFASSDPDERDLFISHVVQATVFCFGTRSLGHGRDAHATWHGRPAREGWCLMTKTKYPGRKSPA